MKILTWISLLDCLGLEGNMILYVVDRLTKSSYFIPAYSTYLAKDYVRIYIDKIVSLHGVPLSIILDRGAHSHQGFGGYLKRFGYSSEVKHCFSSPNR